MTAATALHGAIGRYSRALTRFGHLVDMTLDREVRRDLDAMHDALEQMLDIAEERCTGPARTIDAKAVHRAATLCAHAAEMVLHVHHCLRLGQRLEADAWLAGILQTVHAVEELIDPSPGVALSA